MYKSENSVPVSISIHVSTVYSMWVLQILNYLTDANQILQQSFSFHSWTALERIAHTLVRIVEQTLRSDVIQSRGHVCVIQGIPLPIVTNPVQLATTDKIVLCNASKIRS